MAMRSLPSIAEDANHVDMLDRRFHRMIITEVNGFVPPAKKLEQQAAHAARCEARARINGQPFA